jgi:hypothetical protein
MCRGNWRVPGKGAKAHDELSWPTFVSDFNTGVHVGEDNPEAVVGDPLVRSRERIKLQTFNRRRKIAVLYNVGSNALKIQLSFPSTLAHICCDGFWS